MDALLRDLRYGVRRVVSAPGFTATAITIPSEEGTELYVFDANGRHLRTVNTLTGAKNVASVKSSLVIRPTKRESGVPIETR